MMELAERIEGLAKPCRKADLALHGGYVGSMGTWPTYTKFAENAAKLVPEGMRWAVFNEGIGGVPNAMIMRGNEPVISEGRGATVAIALCAAAVRARAKA